MALFPSTISSDHNCEEPPRLSCDADNAPVSPFDLILSQKERQEHYLRHSLTLVALHSYGRMRLYLEIMPHLMELVQSMLRMTLLLRGMIQVQFLVVLMKALDMNLRKMQLIMTVVR